MVKRFRVAVRSVLPRHLLAFVFMLLPSLASYFVFYRVAYNTIRSSIIENESSDLDRCAAAMDWDLYDLKKMILYYPRNSALLGIDMKDRMDAYDHWVLKQYNEQYSLAIPIVNDIFFYIPRDDLIVTSSGSFAFVKVLFCVTVTIRLQAERNEGTTLA